MKNWGKNKSAAFIILFSVFIFIVIVIGVNGPLQLCNITVKHQFCQLCMFLFNQNNS